MNPPREVDPLFRLAHLVRRLRTRGFVLTAGVLDDLVVAGEMDRAVRFEQKWRVFFEGIGDDAQARAPPPAGF